MQSFEAFYNRPTRRTNGNDTWRSLSAKSAQMVQQLQNVASDPSMYYNQMIVYDYNRLGPAWKSFASGAFGSFQSVVK